MQLRSIFSQKLTKTEFVEKYWQKQPLLIRQAFPHFQSPIDANELAGFAMEEFVESRLVHSDGWKVEHGPFTKQQLTNLPNKEWTLLVQGVDQLVPEVAELLENFRFIPSWRLDDIMVSFATEGGGVGPHFDHYDVFLLQAEGKRHWQLGGYCDNSTELQTGTELAIVNDFKVQQDYVLEPGDMLYLPPLLAHWGTAMENCMTYSIGFRAPSARDIVSAFCDDRLDCLDLSERYRDHSLNAEGDNYLIADSIVEQLRQTILSVLDDKVALADWFGRYATTPRYESIETSVVDESWDTDTVFERASAARFAYCLNEDKAILFANGNRWVVSPEFARHICHNVRIHYYTLENVLSSIDKEALKNLLANGILVRV